MTKKKYANAAEKQRAWRLRHGQKKKVPLEFRKVEELGSSETTFRNKKEDETWEEYHKYLTSSINAARKRQAIAGGKERKDEKPGGRRGMKAKQKGKVKNMEKEEVVFPVEYYEIQRERELELEKIIKGRKIKEKRRKRKNE